MAKGQGFYGPLDKGSSVLYHTSLLVVFPDDPIHGDKSRLNPHQTPLIVKRAKYPARFNDIN